MFRFLNNFVTKCHKYSVKPNSIYFKNKIEKNKLLLSVVYIGQCEIFKKFFLVYVIIKW